MSAQAVVSASGCVLCRGAETERLFEKCGFRLVRCAQCRLIFVDPMPTSDVLRAHYDQEYRDGGCRMAASAASLRQGMFEQRLERLVRLTGRPGRLLDVGCASGLCLETAQERGWDGWGVELSREAVASLPEAMQGRVHCGTLSTAPFQRASFDLLTMFDVIEHCPDPLDVVRSAFQFLKPAGIIAFTTPNIDSLPARVMGRHYSYINPPDHLVYFSPRTLAVLLDEAGFHLLATRRASKTFSIDYLLALLPRTNPGLSRLFRALAKPLPGSCRSRRLSCYAGEMFVVARKRGDV